MGLAVAATGALAFAGAAPAAAATVNVSSADVIGYQDDAHYDQWHVGSVPVETPVEDSLTFNECSVVTGDAPTDHPATITQVLKGFEAGQIPTADAERGTDELRGLIDSIEIEVESGVVSVQVPSFHYDSADSDGEFTTYRNAGNFGEGNHTLEGETLTATRGIGAALPSGSTFEDVLDGFDAELAANPEASFEFLGVGFTGTPGSIVNSITFDGDTYRFGENPGSCDDNGTPELPGGSLDDIPILGSIIGSLPSQVTSSL